MSARHAVDTRWPTPWNPPGSAARRSAPSVVAVAAAPLLAALFARLGEQASPCAGHDLWTSEDPDDVLVAQEGCASCPARRECAEYAVAVDATCGTWGGVDRTQRDGRRRPMETRTA